MTRSPDIVKYIPTYSLRKMFNESQIPQLIKDGKLTPRYLRNRHLDNPAVCGEPWCTYAQMIRYLDEHGQWVAEVFQYLRNDNTLGASGKPDPKRLKVGNIIFASESR